MIRTTLRRVAAIGVLAALLAVGSTTTAHAATVAPVGTVLSTEHAVTDSTTSTGSRKHSTTSRTCRASAPNVRTCVKVTDTVTTSAKGAITHTHTVTTTVTPKGGKPTTTTVRTA